MRVPWTQEIKDLYKIVSPYWDLHGGKKALIENTPDNIRELNLKFWELYEKNREEFMEAFFGDNGI